MRPGKKRGKADEKYKMAAIRGNTPKRVKKQSMAEELMSLVNLEEYSNPVLGLTEDEYLTKTEIASMRKMISGKLWIDTRRFSNRQNQCIPTGMYELFGHQISKSAIDVHAEMSQYFLEPERKALRDVLRKSMKENKLTFSKWITNLNDINRPCDEYGLHLLCHCYNRHACIITAKRLWSSFKGGKMNTYAKIQKCDMILIWLGESKFAEVKPLQNTAQRSTQEWQLLSECVNHLHEKNAKNKTTRKARSVVATDIATIEHRTKPSMKTDATQGHASKRKRATIDYRQYHNDGTVIEKSPPLSKKILPRATGPSETRLAAQEMIKQERTSAKQADKIIGTVTVKKELVQSTRASRIQNKLIKEEPNIRLVHRKEKTPENVRIVVTHPSGRLCRHPDRGILGIDELPDLPSAQPASQLRSPPRVSRTPGRSTHVPSVADITN